MSYNTLKEPLKQYPTWIIAYCIDTGHWFVTNYRGFFYEYQKEFDTENEALIYLESNLEGFCDTEYNILKERNINSAGKLLYTTANGDMKLYESKQFPYHICSNGILLFVSPTRNWEYVGYEAFKTPEEAQSYLEEQLSSYLHNKYINSYNNILFYLNLDDVIKAYYGGS